MRSNMGTAAPEQPLQSCEVSPNSLLEEGSGMGVRPNTMALLISMESGEINIYHEGGGGK